jgi:4,5-dihydroxyphthalate decarboxylase
LSEPVKLRTVLEAPPLATLLKQGNLTSPGVRLDFAKVAPVHKAFAPMVRQQAYDLSELAIVSCLQAVAYDRPIVMLPIVVASRFQRGCLIAHRSRGVPAPEELAGKRIGVRSYTQTTGMWVRAHLKEDYGLSTPSIRWFTRDPAHVEEYHDPAFVAHMSGSEALADMLRAGELDAVILGNDLPGGDEFVPVIPDASARDLTWWLQHRFMPINHMMVASRDLARDNPEALKEACRLLKSAHELTAVPKGKPSPVLFGFTALREPLRWIVDACMEQGLLPRRLGFDQVFGPAERILGGLLE